MRGGESASRSSPAPRTARGRLADHPLPGLPRPHPPPARQPPLATFGFARPLARTAPRRAGPTPASDRRRPGQGNDGRSMTVPAPVPDPRWNELRKLVVDSVSSAHSQRAYGFALDDFFNGTPPNSADRSRRRSCRNTAYTSRRRTCRPRPSTFAWPRSASWRSRPPTTGCSRPNSPPASPASAAPNGSAPGRGTGLRPRKQRRCSTRPIARR